MPILPLIYPSEFKIALQTAGVNSLRQLTELVSVEPNSTRFQRFGRLAGKNGQGMNVRIGFPQDAWIWNLLPQRDIDTLEQFAGQWVYYRTETDRGVTTRTFKIYLAYCQPLTLSDTDRFVGFGLPDDGYRQTRPVTMEFSTLQLYVPP